MKNPVVSVLMTAYNREKYIGEAIESVLSQTYSDWELIVTDDVSKDKTVEIVRGYASKDPRIKLYVNDTNLGDYPNRNRAASYAKGKYLKYLDADDLMYPWALGSLVMMMEANPSAGWGLCSLDSEDKIYPILLSPKETYMNHYFRRSLFHKAPLSSIIKRDVFEEVGGFSGKQHLGDFEMWHILGRRYPLLTMPHGMVWYRTHDDQQMADNRTDPFVPFKYDFIKIELVNHDDSPLSSDERESITSNVERSVSRAIAKQFINLNLAKARQMREYCQFSIGRILSNLIIKSK
ncbi:MAG: glycosyltransferase family 2 protein [Rikenellaceae bacterium]